MRLERNAWLIQHPRPWSEETEHEYISMFGDRVESWLDQGHGGCALRHREVATIVEQAFRHFDGERYWLGPFVIMPNHVHLLFQPAGDHSVAKILHSWKSYTAKQINILRRSSGPFWQEDYWDRIVRSDEQWHAYRGYIERNPKGLKEGTFVLGFGSRARPTWADA